MAPSASPASSLGMPRIRDHELAANERFYVADLAVSWLNEEIIRQLSAIFNHVRISWRALAEGIHNHDVICLSKLDVRAPS
jgi:hypothetical protein